MVHSCLGTGRAGCFVAVSIAKMMIQSEAEPLTWDSDSNLLDQVHMQYVIEHSDKDNIHVEHTYCYTHLQVHTN